MLKKILVLSFLFIAIQATSQEIAMIRSQYPLAEKSEEIASQLDQELSSGNSESQPILIAYRGGVKSLMAKFAKKVKDKKDYFKEGVELLESAVKSEPANIEIRYIRLSVQENAPKFLKYDANISEDKEFILENYSAISSQAIKSVVKDFVSESKSFNEPEKQSLR